MGETIDFPSGERAWVYEQRTGRLLLDGNLIAIGYSGHNEGKNNPALQEIHELGPLPRGWYDIGDLFYSRDHGPDCLRLTPRPETEMFGRAGMLIHGDKIGDPGAASLGCIIMARLVRQRIAQSGVKLLQVVEG